jgi:PBSX family phage terminase large subunit
MSIITKEVIFHKKQKEAFNFKTQYCACIAGVQSGKTFLGAYWAGKQIADMAPDGIGLICAPTYKILQQSTLPKFFKEFEAYRQYYKEQKGQIEFPDGRIVYIRSMDDPYGVEGMTLDWAWGDEAGQFSLLAWIVLRSRTSIKKGKILFTTTPYNMGWLYQDFFLPWKEGKDKDLSVFTWASVENPYFPKEFFEKEKIRLRQEEFNRRYLGEFTKMEGLVYDIHQWHIMEPKEIRADITIGGIDWGYTNPAGVIICKYYDGHWYIVDEWYQTGKTTREIIEQCQKMQNGWGVNRWYADSANPEKIEEANRSTGLYVIPYNKGKDKGKDAITAGVSMLQQEFKENRIHIFNTCKNFLKEGESYHYPETREGKVNKDQPEPVDNHLMDATRYAIHGYQPARKFPTKPREGSYAQFGVKYLLEIKDSSNNERKGTSYE